MKEHYEVNWCPVCATNDYLGLKVGDVCASCGDGELVSVDEAMLPVLNHAVISGFETEFCCCGFGEHAAYISIRLPWALEGKLKQLFDSLNTFDDIDWYSVTHSMYEQHHTSISVDHRKLSIYVYADEKAESIIDESAWDSMIDKFIDCINDIEDIYQDICDMNIRLHLSSTINDEGVRK